METWAGPPRAARHKNCPNATPSGFSGANAVCFSSLPLTGGGSSTLALVECLQHEWSLLALAVNPEERQIPVIVEAEAATLASLLELSSASGAVLRVHSAVGCTLAGSRERLGLAEPAAGGAARGKRGVWRCSGESQRLAAGDCEDRSRVCSQHCTAHHHSKLC